MKKLIALMILICISISLNACSSESSTDHFDPSEGIVTDQKDIDLSEEIAADTEGAADWQNSYLEIICNMQEYLVDIDGYRSNPELYNPMDDWVYLGIHDFNGDSIPELLVGDTLTMAVFTFSDGKPEKIADLYDEYEPLTWCINGVHFKDNSVSLGCSGSGGTTFVNFGYLDDQYVIGHYSENNQPSVARINGKESTLEEMNKIYATDYAQREPEENRERIRLVNEDGVWILKFQSGDEKILDDQFDYGLIMWE